MMMWRSRNNADDPRALRAGLSGRRGVAMVLVLVAIATAGAVTTFYVVSQDNSARIGANAESAATAGWSAESGAKLAVAALQTNVDWRTASSDGVLLENSPFPGQDVKVLLTDLEGNPPGPDDQDIVVTVRARVNGVEKVCQRQVRVTPDVAVEQAVDPELKEFGAFLSNEIRTEADSRIGTWSKSPGAKSGRTIKLGAGFSSVGDFKVNGETKFVDAQLFVTKEASSSMQSMVQDGRFAGGGTIPVRVPAPAVGIPSDFDHPYVPVGDADYDDDREGTKLPDFAIYQDFRVRDSGVITMADGDYEMKSLTLDNGGVMQYSGTVRLWVKQNFLIQNYGALEPADENSTLELYVGGDFKVDDGTVGFGRALARTDERALDDVPGYVDPSRVKVFALAESQGGVSSPTFEMHHEAIGCMLVHVPHGAFNLESNAKLLGRVTSNTLYLRTGTALLYDPALDSGVGFTSKTSPMWDENGDPVDGLEAALDSFDEDAGLDALVSHIAANVTGGATVDPGPDMDGVAHRRLSRATPSDWPMDAVAQESAASGGGDKGSVVESLDIDSVLSGALALGGEED